MGDTISKWHELQEESMSDREIMNAKRGIDKFEDLRLTVM